MKKATLASSVGLSIKTSTITCKRLQPKITNKKKKWARLVVVVTETVWKAVWNQARLRFGWFGNRIGLQSELRLAGTITVYTGLGYKV